MKVLNCHLRKTEIGYITSYTINISLKEATKLNFIDEDGKSFPLHKEIVDNKLIISKALPNQSAVHLCPKRTVKGYISSYNLIISKTEAKTLKLVDKAKEKFGYSFKLVDYCFIADKQIVDDKLVISRAIPQTPYELHCLIEDFGLIGKRLSKKTLLDLLHFIEGDSKSYIKQRDNIYDSIRLFKIPRRKQLQYQGRFAFFVFDVEIDSKKIITGFYTITRTMCDYF